MNGTQDHRYHASAGETPAPASTSHAAPHAVLAPLRDPRSKSPALACCLSAMPGLGQVYVGYYQRGFVHAAVFASLITILAAGQLDNATPLVAIFLPFFYLYNIVDAGRRAAFYNQILTGQQGVDLPQDFRLPGIGGSILGGLVLIVIGFVLLLNTRFAVSLDWLEEWWPIIPILLGLYLLGKALGDRMSKDT